MPMESQGKRDDLRISTFVPPFYRCPISLELMTDPVSLCTGVTYDRSSIEKWLDDGNSFCPVTMEPLQSLDVTPNHTLRRLIQAWCVSKGFDRIPTPKSPADPARIRQMMDDIIRDDNANRRLDTLRALKNLARASERNRKCMRAAGVLSVLARVFTNSDRDGGFDMEILREALAGIVCFLPDDDSLKLILRGPRLLRSLELVLGKVNNRNDSNTEARTNAAILIEGLSKDRASAREIGSNEAIIECLIGLLGEDIEEEEEEEEMYSAAIRASLNALLNLCSVVRNRVKILEANAVPALTGLVSGDETELSERSLAVLDALSTTAEGRAAIDEHALAVPAIVKSLLVVSNAANEHAVGILWRICSKSSEEDLLNEALLDGAFKKLLVLVQIDSSSPTTKVKANQILKLLSPIRHAH